MKITETDIPGCLLIEPRRFSDLRGSFMEVYHQQHLEEVLGAPVHFVQDNQSVSRKGVLRGLHYQEAPHAQAKLVQVTHGAVRDVVVDLRRDSPTFGKHLKLELSSENGKQLFIPKGLAHGFLTLVDQTVFSYKCDAYYHPKSEKGLLFNDPELGINWEEDPKTFILSEKDRALPGFKSLLP